MLENLRIENFAIIDKLDINFHDNLNVIIGQTGAGKTILIEALSLLNGSKSDFSKVRDISKKAVVEGTFILSDEFIKQHNYLNDYLEDNTLIISRILFSNQKTQIRVNGEIVSLNVLKSITKDIIDIFSQNESSYLFDKNNQLDLLDNYIKDSDLSLSLTEYKKEYDLYLSIEKEINEFKKSTNLEMEDYLTYQINEIESYHLKENEIEDLNKEKDDLSNYEKIIDLFKEINTRYYINSNQTLLDAINTLKSPVNGLIDTSLKEQASEVISSIDNLDQSFRNLFSSYEDLDFSPNRLDNINERLFNLTTLQHKYGKSTSEILSKYEDLKKDLDNIKSYDTKLKDLINKKEEQVIKLNELANKITNLRYKVKDNLEEKINNQLSSLLLKEGGFKIEINEVPLYEKGNSNVEFKCLLNKGGKYLPLNKVLSGGENARLNLALKTVFNKQNHNDVIIFDEIDTGISMDVAYLAGLKMVEISKSSQLIVITHLVQVACLADFLYLVYKHDDNEKTISEIKELNQDEIILNISKMISLNTNLDSANSTAKDLYNQAQKDKKNIN